MNWTDDEVKAMQIEIRRLRNIVREYEKRVYSLNEELELPGHTTTGGDIMTPTTAHGRHPKIIYLVTCIVRDGANDAYDVEIPAYTRHGLNEDTVLRRAAREVEYRPSQLSMHISRVIEL